jgi:membrane protein YdbS with pleckstrin-like domain
VGGIPESVVVGRRRRTSSIGAILLVIWLVIGVIAAAQRGYFTGGDANCATVSTIVVTVLAGPLNYLGVNPQVQCPELPQPSE